MKKLKNGSKGAEVKTLQSALNKAGAKPKLKVDGKFGSKTETAVETFQKKNKLKVTGIAAEDTLATLGLGGKATEWPLADVDRERRELEKHFLNARKTIRASLGQVNKHKAYSVVSLGYDMEDAEKKLFKVFTAADKPLETVCVLKNRFDQLPLAKLKERDALVAKAKKENASFNRLSGAFYGHIIEIGRIEGQIKSAIDKRTRVVWNIPEYRSVYKRNQKRLKAADARIQEILSDCTHHHNDEVRTFAKKAKKTLEDTKKAFARYESMFDHLVALGMKFDVHFNDMRDDDLLKILKDAKKAHSLLMSRARTCIGHLKSCWHVEKHHRKLIGFA